MAAMRDDDAEAAVDGERGEDTTSVAVRDEVGRLSGVHHRAMLFAADGAGRLSAREPSQKRISRVCREISELTGRRWTWLNDTEEQVARINRKLVGWANYFCLGPVSKAYRAVD